MTSHTLEVLKAGGFKTVAHDKMANDIKLAEEADPGCWIDMVTTLNRVKDGTYRSDDWSAPLDRNNGDLGEIKRKRGGRLYRLYVHAARGDFETVTLLHFGWKRPGRVGFAAQDEQIDEAYHRLMSPTD